MHADGSVDYVAIALGHALDDGKILLLDRPSFELGGHSQMGLVSFCHDDHAAGVPIQAMHNARTRGPAQRAQVIEVVGQGARQRARPVPFSGVNHHARGFVDRDQMCVFVDHVQWDVFRLRALTRELRRQDDDTLAGSKPIRDFGALAVDRHAVSTDGATKLNTGIAWEVSREERVQTLPRLVRGHNED
jgi:hypothetical protein